MAIAGAAGFHGLDTRVHVDRRPNSSIGGPENGPPVGLTCSGPPWPRGTGRNRRAGACWIPASVDVHGLGPPALRRPGHRAQEGTIRGAGRTPGEREYVYALGGNRSASIYSGIDIGRVQVIVYGMIGFLSALSGVVLCARMYSGQPTVGSGFELDAIAAVVLGGTSFTGGIGTLGGMLLGVFVIGILNNGLNLLNINSFWQLIVKGVVILFAVYVDTLKKKRRT